MSAETDPDGRLFAPSSDPVAELNEALERAGDNDRRVLVVLGANWCHDSRALAARLHRSPLAEVVDDNYELVFVDVGFLDKGRDVLDEIDVPQFYATPTVLVVDPASGSVLNEEDRHIWANAYNIDMDASVEYFERWADGGPLASPAMASPELQRLYAEIARFEQQQAERVAGGYEVVGPMLEAYKAGNPPPAFNASWNELRDFRMSIPGDVRELREQAERRVSQGEQDVQLELPEYPPLSWESE